MTHAKEPWGIEDETINQWREIEVALRDANGNVVAILQETHLGAECLKDTTMRIVACVNACAGMGDPETEITHLRLDKADMLDIERALSYINRRLRQDKAKLVEALVNMLTDTPFSLGLCIYCGGEAQWEEGEQHYSDCDWAKAKATLAKHGKES